MPDPAKPSDPPPHTASDAIPHVPRKLLDELHQANQDFSDARQEREAAIDLPVYTHAPREQAKQHVREAEKKVEDVTEKIDGILRSADGSKRPE